MCSADVASCRPLELSYLPTYSAIRSWEEQRERVLPNSSIRGRGGGMSVRVNILSPAMQAASDHHIFSVAVCIIIINGRKRHPSPPLSYSLISILGRPYIYCRLPSFLPSPFCSSPVISNAREEESNHAPFANDDCPLPRFS